MIVTKIDHVKQGACVFDCILFDSGRKLVSLFSDGTLKLYDTGTKKCSEIKSGVKFKYIYVSENGILSAISEIGCLKNYTVNGLEATLNFTENLQICSNGDFRTTSIVSNDNSTILSVAIESCSPKRSDDDDDDNDDLEEEDRARIMFYDCRQSTVRPLGCYKESHSSGVTCLKFAPNFNDYLLSGGSDGLVNVYDLRQSNEDDALLHSFNCECSVAKSNFYGNEAENLKLYTITDDNSLCAWKVNDEGDDIFQIRNAKLNDATFLVDCFLSREDMFQVFSTVDGGVTIGRLDSSNRLQFVDFYAGAHKDLIRCSSWYDDLQLLATGGDDGTINLSKIEIKTDANLKLMRNKKKFRNIY